MSVNSKSTDKLIVIKEIIEKLSQGAYNSNNYTLKSVNIDWVLMGQDEFGDGGTIVPNLTVEMK